MARTKAKQASKSKKKGGGNTPQDAISLLKTDHRKVEELFKQFEAAASDEKPDIVQNICKELIIHAFLEEEIFYPACRHKGVDDKLDEAQVEHDSTKALITQLLNEDEDADFYDAQVKVLAEYVKHHVAEEEKPKEGIFAKAQKEGLDMGGLGKRLKQRKTELLEKAQSGRLPLPRPKSFDVSQMLAPDKDPKREDGEEEGGWNGDEGHGDWFGHPRGHAQGARRGLRSRD